MKHLDFGRQKIYTQNRTDSEYGKKKNEKFNRSFLLQSFPKHYHFFARLFEELFEKIKMVNKFGNPKKTNTLASL